MSPHCCDHAPPPFARPVLWIALAINAAMFITELVAGVIAGSVSLHADGYGTLWPDVIVAAVMAALALQGSATVIRQSLSELNAVTSEARS